MHRGNKQQKSLRQEGQDAHGEGERTVSKEIEEVEVDREVVSRVSPRNVVEVRFVDELTPIPGEIESTMELRGGTYICLALADTCFVQCMTMHYIHRLVKVCGILTTVINVYSYNNNKINEFLNRLDEVSNGRSRK